MDGHPQNPSPRPYKGGAVRAPAPFPAAAISFPSKAARHLLPNTNAITIALGFTTELILHLAVHLCHHDNAVLVPRRPRVVLAKSSHSRATTELATMERSTTEPRRRSSTAPHRALARSLYPDP
jgi:hypothetical protein